MAIYSDEKIEFFQRATRDSTFVMPQSHFHSKHELYYLEKGTTKYFIGSEIYLLEAGDLIFVPKGCFHKTATDQVAERLLFMFDDEFVGSEYLHYIEGMKSASRPTSSISSRRYSARSSRRISTAATAIWRWSDCICGNCSSSSTAIA